MPTRPETDEMMNKINYEVMVVLIMSYSIQLLPKHFKPTSG